MTLKQLPIQTYIQKKLKHTNLNITIWEEMQELYPYVGFNNLKA